MQRSTPTIVALICAASMAHAQYNAANLSLKDEIAVEQYSFDRLRIYPITANRVFLESHKGVGAYKPLKEGLADGSVKIIERGATDDIALQNINAENLAIAADEETAEVEPVPILEEGSHYVEEVAPEFPQETQQAIQQLSIESYRNADGHVRMYQQLQANHVIEVSPDANWNDDEGLEVQQRIINNLDGGAGDAVNQLYIENTGNDTLFIMAGEVVKGGKQDRVIAMDMVIPPHSEPVDLSVYCVEHGRWSYGATDAADGFTGHANVANTSVRKAAIVEKEQTAVWSKVEEVTLANDAVSETGTLNSLEGDADYQQELKEYEAKFADLPSSGVAVVGVVAVTGDRVIACDLFATPDLFKNAFPDLLKSYASEAITSGSKVTIGTAQVSKYISEILDETKQEEVVGAKGQMYKRGARTLHISSF
ncbi:MAG: DUF6569 family protein [Bacteroidia bacterium]